MRHRPISREFFIQNRTRLKQLLPSGSLAILNANDILPTNADGSVRNIPNADLFYLTGIEQEQSILLLCPDAAEETHREILFLREPTESVQIWEGNKLTREQATEISGIATVKWLSEFPKLFQGLIFSTEQVFLNSNEHRGAALIVPSRDHRFIEDCQRRYPLHTYRRLAPLLHRLRVEKSDPEIELIREAIRITRDGFLRVLNFVKPDIMEYQVEAEFAHEFISRRATFAYSPIIASGKNACGLHYYYNDQPCCDGDLLLMDVGAAYANYNADMTRTIPVNGRFTVRQREIYDAVLRVLKASVQGATVGTLYRNWHYEAQCLLGEELLRLGLLKPDDIAKQTRLEPACKKYFMHGLGHPLGLDVHDVSPADQPFAPGWILTVEPGVYLPEEGIGIRLENNILITENGPIDLMSDIPIEADEIEALMANQRHH